jgi:hypothetical protein
MNAHPRETSFLTHIGGYDDGGEPLKLEKSIAQVRRNKWRVKRFALVMALFPLLAIAGVGYETMLQRSFPYDGPHPVIRVLCEIGLASVICLVAFFAGLLIGYRRKLSQLRDQCRPLATRLLEPQWDMPDIATLPGSDRGSDNREAFQGAAEVTGYDGSLDSPSWRSNRLCG